METTNLNNLFDFMSNKGFAVRYGDLLRAGFTKEVIEKEIDNQMACLVKDHVGYTIITYTPAIRGNQCCNEDILYPAAIERILSRQVEKKGSRIKRLLRMI